MTKEQLQLREQFKYKRLGYYQAGRYLAFSGVGGQSYFIMLGYAIEMHIKAALAELEYTGLKLTGGDIRLLYSHKIKELYYLAKTHGLYKNVEVSDYFLDLAENFLHTRYPSQEAESKKRMTDKSYEISVYNIFPYDDLICQLDQELFAISGNENDSIIILTAKYLNTSESIPVIHCNAFAFEMIEPIKEQILNNPAVEDHHKQLLSTGMENLWALQKGLFVPFEMYDEILEKYNCLNFRLNGPKIGIDENGRETWEISSNNPVGLKS